MSVGPDRPPGEDSDFPRALAAAGIIAAQGELATSTPGALAASLRTILDARDPSAPLGWWDPTLPYSADLPLASTRDWAMTWRELDVGQPVSLAMSEVAGGPDPAWITRTLVDAGLGLSPFMALDRPVTGTPWRFPLRVGFLDTPGDRRRLDRLVEGFEYSSWQSTLIEPVTIGRERVACDLLVLDQPAHEAAVAVERLREARAGAVLVTHGLDTWDSVLVDRLATATDAWAVGFTGVDDPHQWLLELMVRLSHDQTLDMAFTRTIDRDGVLAAVVPVIARERVSRRAEAVAGALREADAGPPRSPVPVLLPLPEISLADEFEQVALFGDFGMETRASSELARLEREAAPLLDGAEARRHLQARISAGGTSLDRLRAGTAHQIDVRIGARSLDWLSLARPFPDDELPMSGSNRLTVVLTEPHLLDAPVVREVVLPPSGDSTVATFSLVTAADTTVVDARLIVLHRNRVLQTARLPSEVDQIGVEPSGGRVDVVTPETFVAPATGDLAARRSFDVAFLVNKSADGESRITHAHGDSAGIVRLDGGTLDGTVKKIKKRLGKIVNSPDDFGGLDQEASVRLLAFLAYHGKLMRDELVADATGLAAVLDRSRYIQVVSAKPDAYFPFELAYDYPAPGPGARLCPAALDALAAEDIDAGCSGAHTREVVCPYGFWGLTRVIERHAFQSADSVVGEYMLKASTSRYRDRIPLGGAILAASAHVDGFAAGSIASVATALHTDHVVDKWDDWIARVSTERPALLVLLPHTIYSEEWDTYGLEIGTDDQYLSGDIDRTFVPPEDRPVIVALLGCETARTDSVLFEQFPSRLRIAGAEVVIATLTEVLGRHAAPMAVRLVGELDSLHTPQGMGEVMVRLRRKLLRDGLLAVLAVVAFGDADWLISRAP